MNATDYERGAASFREAGRTELARLALKRAKQLRDQGDISTRPEPFTIEEVGQAAVQFSQTGQHVLAAQAREVIGKMLWGKTRKD